MSKYVIFAGGFIVALIALTLVALWQFGFFKDSKPKPSGLVLPASSVAPGVDTRRRYSRYGSYSTRRR